MIVIIIEIEGTWIQLLDLGVDSPPQGDLKNMRKNKIKEWL